MLVRPSLSPTYGRMNSFAGSSRFKAWQAAANILVGLPSAEEKAAYIKLSDFKLPRAILEVRSGHHWPSLKPSFDLIENHCHQSVNPKDKRTYRKQDTFHRGLAGWAVIHPGDTVDWDVHDIVILSQALYVSFFRLHHSVTTAAVELTQRRAIDDLVEMAFMGRPESIHSVV